MKALVPYDRTNPVIYDNDCHSDVYTDELLLALSSAGEIDLKGFITTSPANPAVNHDTYEFDAVSRVEILRKAERSGLRNIPPHYRGPSEKLARPSSERIEDTIPLETEASRFIIEEARKAKGKKPVVIAMGGPLTSVADAWLLNNDIGGNVIVSWLGGNMIDMFDYNGWADAWAAYIVVSKLRMVQFPAGRGAPEVPKSRLSELPDCELRQWMIDKRLPHVNALPRGLAEDGDAQPVISIMQPDFVRRVRRVTFGHWGFTPGGEPVPVFKDDEAGNVIMATEVDRRVSNNEWWRIMTSPAVWAHCTRNPARAQRPFYAAPFPIGKIRRIEVEDFDHGGEGIAFHKSSTAIVTNAYRETPVEIIEADDTPGGYNVGAEGGYAVSGMRRGEWLEYTVDIGAQGVYDMVIRAKPSTAGVVIHLELDGEDKTGPVRITSTAVPPRWECFPCGRARLNTGSQVVRLCIDEARSRAPGDAFNYIEMRQSSGSIG